MKEIAQILAFVVEIEKLKDVHRKARPVGLERLENSAAEAAGVAGILGMLPGGQGEA